MTETRTKRRIGPFSNKPSAKYIQMTPELMQHYRTVCAVFDAYNETTDTPVFLAADDALWLALQMVERGKDAA